MRGKEPEGVMKRKRVKKLKGVKYEWEMQRERCAILTLIIAYPGVSVHVTKIK